MTNTSLTNQVSVLSESEVAEIEREAQGNVKDPGTYMFLLSRLLPLCATVKALREERQRAIDILSPDVPRTDVCDAARQIVFAHALEKGSADKLQSQLEALREENERLKTHWANTSEDLASAWLKSGELQERLSQVEQELAEEKRLRVELKQIAQTVISEVSSVGTAMKEIAVIDFRSRAVELCKQKAAEYESKARASIEHENIRYWARARAARELADELEKL